MWPATPELQLPGEEYLHFLDDDDWLLPNAFECFRLLDHRVTDTAWLYGGSQLVDRAEKPLIKLRHGLNGNCFAQVMAGEWIPLQASLIDTEAFFAVGGFNPLIPGIEDIDLTRRIALHGNTAGVSSIVACIGMGRDGSTTNETLAQQYGRWAREGILSEAGVFNRMRMSASNSYWYGRLIRIYLTSMVWNFQRKNLFTALSRAMFGALGFFAAGWHILSVSFWQAISARYESKTFLTGFQEAQRPRT